MVVITGFLVIFGFGVVVSDRGYIYKNGVPLEDDMGWYFMWDTVYIQNVEVMSFPIKNSTKLAVLRVVYLFDARDGRDMMNQYAVDMWNEMVNYTGRENISMEQAVYLDAWVKNHTYWNEKYPKLWFGSEKDGVYIKENTVVEAI